MELTTPEKIEQLLMLETQRTHRKGKEKKVHKKVFKQRTVRTEKRII